MNVNLAEKLKLLRKERNISQEKLAEYLGVSFQAVSKWENANAYPDITLLPEIARFFGITVDELLQVEIIDEKKLYAEYEARAAALFRNGQIAETLPLWQEAYHRMPNNVEVKEMLMSAYFDTDKRKYQNEIIELGSEIYNSGAGSYYQGQAITQIARTYAAVGNAAMAEQWAMKAHQLMHAQEMLFMQITEDGGELLEQFSFSNYWYFNELFYMAARISGCDDFPGGTKLVQAIDRAVAQIYEIVYPNDDMSFESLRSLCDQHRSIAEEEIELADDETVVRTHLTRAMECAVKSVSVEAHTLTHPLVYGWEVQAALSDKTQVVRMLKRQLSRACFDGYRDTAWFAAIEVELERCL